MDESFTVTLPSNSNMKEYPKNTSSEYTVKLATPLNFMSDTLNVGNAWQVALLGIQYTNHFYEIRKPIEVSLRVKKLTSGERRPPEMSRPPDWHAQRGDRPLLGDPSVSAPDPNHTPGTPPAPDHIIIAADDDSGVRAVPTAGTFVIEAGHYKDVQAVAKELVRDWSLLDKTKTRNASLSVHVDGHRGTLEFKVSPEDVVVYLYVNTMELPDMLGLPAFPTSDPTQHRMYLRGYRPPRIDRVQSLYTYTDIIKDQYVGDVLAPLLDVVPVQQTPGVRINYRSNPPMYLPLKQSYIDTISIKICDEYGNLAVFPEGAENVVLRLRFRRVTSKMVL